MKILLVQLSFLGDIILTTPVISGLKTIYPSSSVSVLTTVAGSFLLENDPLIDEVITFDKREKEKGVRGILQKARQLKEKEFDRVYSVHRSYRTALMLFFSGISQRTGFADSGLSFLYSRRVKRSNENHAVLRNLSILSGETDENLPDPKLRLFPPETDGCGRKVNEFLLSHKKYAVIAPSSAWKTKMWHWQGFVELIHFFRGNGMEVVLIGGKDDTQVCDKIALHADVYDLSGRLSLKETMMVMERSRIAVCNDSMPLHMASAFKKPAVAIFCATSPKFGFGPWKNPNAVIVQDELLECRPCRRHGSKECPNKSGLCMEVPAERVIDACRNLLSERLNNS